MKHRTIRGVAARALALLLVLSLFVGFCGMTAFAADGSESPGMLDAMAKIRAIIIMKLPFDPRGGTMRGHTDAVTVEAPMGLAFYLPEAAEKANDTFLGWKAVVNGETKTFKAMQRVHIWEPTSFSAVWASDSDVNPNEANMKLDIRG